MDTEALRNKLPQEAIDLLDTQDGRYSEWATASALAMHALNAEFSEDEYVAVVSESDFAYEFATENGRDRTDRLESRLRKAWNRAEENWNPPLGDTDRVRLRLAEVSRRVESYPWKGRAGVSDRTVALALLAYAHGNGAWTLDMSTRRLSELSGVSKNTASASLRRLAKLGLIQRIEQEDHNPTDAARWGIVLDWNPRRDTTGTHKPLPPITNYVSQVCPFTHPVFLTAALGQTAGRVWFGLPDDGSLTAAELAERLRLNTKTVRRNLNVLVSVGLACKSEGRPARYSLVNVSTEYLNELAEQYGTLDWSERKAETYKAQREGFQQYLLLEEIKRSEQGDKK